MLITKQEWHTSNHGNVKLKIIAEKQIIRYAIRNVGIPRKLLLLTRKLIRRYIGKKKTKTDKDEWNVSVKTEIQNNHNRYVC